MGYEVPIVKPPADYPGDFFKVDNGLILKMTRVFLSLQEKACLLTRDSSHDSHSSIHYFFQDIADGLVGVGLITQSEDCPGVLTLDKGYNDMSKFLNRILGLKVELQNILFKYFSDTLAAIISSAKRAGKYDQVSPLCASEILFGIDCSTLFIGSNL